MDDGACHRVERAVRVGRALVQVPVQGSDEQVRGCRPAMLRRTPSTAHPLSSFPEGRPLSRRPWLALGWPWPPLGTPEECDEFGRFGPTLNLVPDLSLLLLLAALAPRH